MVNEKKKHNAAADGGSSRDNNVALSKIIHNGQNKTKNDRNASRTCNERLSDVVEHLLLRGRGVEHPVVRLLRVV